MDDQQALAIVAALANGANPHTGEVFAQDSPYQSPDVIRALFAAQRALESRLNTGQRGTNSSRPSEPRGNTHVGKSNAGKPWSDEEDRQLLAAFDADKSLADIAQTHGRTAAGIRARLEKHGRLEPSGATRWPPHKGNRSATGAVLPSTRARSR